ncbi:hypothetical protein [Bradyrhizobium sp. STM 3557]
MDLFAREVLPDFEHDAWKQGALNPEIGLGEIDTAALPIVTTRRR